MRILAIRVKNYKSLQDMRMEGIPGFAVLVGANGSGKSTLIDIFQFLKDALKDDVRAALNSRGGFAQVVTRGHADEDIEIELKIEMDIAALASTAGRQSTRIVTYLLKIAQDGRNVRVAQERLSFKRGSYGHPYHFIDFANGRGGALADSFDTLDVDVPLTELHREEQALDKPYGLALKGLGQFKRFDAASQLRALIEEWQVTDVHIPDARKEPDAASAQHLNSDGTNIALYAQYLHEDHPEIFATILRLMARSVPGVTQVASEDLGDGRVALRFWDRAFADGFLARAVSDGTLKMFAYLALLGDPNPHPLLCIEEPENQLYPSLLAALAEQFAAYAERRNPSGQVLVTTHSPDFLNHVPLRSIYWLEKESGYSVARRAFDDPQLRDLVEAGDVPGELWRQGLFGRANP